MPIQIKILSDENLQRIHERSLHLLSNTGIRVDTLKGRALLEQAGAVSNKGSNIIRLPAELVEKAIQSAPREVNPGRKARRVVICGQPRRQHPLPERGRDPGHRSGYGGGAARSL
jgi:trimethylamine:corrinoid methyltransferase-like protein